MWLNTTGVLWHCLPLCRAAELNQVQVAEALLDYGIDVHATECNGRWVVSCASRLPG
jgi:hypothetical protein